MPDDVAIRTMEEMCPTHACVMDKTDGGRMVVVHDGDILRFINHPRRTVVRI